MNARKIRVVTSIWLIALLLLGVGAPSPASAAKVPAPLRELVGSCIVLVTALSPEAISGTVVRIVDGTVELETQNGQMATLQVGSRVFVFVDKIVAFAPCPPNL
jgi:hypothetical protein